MVALGNDYALARRTTWVFPEAGVGPATAVLTRRALYIFPHRAFSGTALTRTRTTFTIGGRSPLDAILDLLNHPTVTVDDVDRQLITWATEVTGPVREDLGIVKRIRIFNGWCRRGVAFSEKTSGYDVRPKAVRPTKEEMPAFIALLRGFPGLEMM